MSDRVIAFVNGAEHKGQEMIRFFQTFLGFPSLEQFKKNAEVYECLNPGIRSYQTLIQKMQGKEKFLKKLYSEEKEF